MRINRWWWGTAMVIASAQLAGCDAMKGLMGKEETEEEETDTEVEKEEEEEEPKAKTKGLDAEDNDKEIVAQVKGVLECEWGQFGFSFKCDAFKQWNEKRDLKGKDETFVNFLEDEREQVRFLGASAIAFHGESYRHKDELAKRVVAAAKAESNVVVAPAMGSAAGRINGKGTSTQEDLKNLAASHKLVELRRNVVGSLLLDNKELYDFVKGLAKTDKDESVRVEATRSLVFGTPEGQEGTSCAFWLELVSDGSQEVAGTAASGLSIFRPFRDNGCVNQFDAMMTKIEGFAKEGKIKNFQLASSLHNVHRHSAATEDHKKKAIAVAKAIVENKDNEGFPRARALAFIGEVDPGGKAYAARFKNDPDFSVKRQAEDIAAGKGFTPTKEETRVSTKPVPGKVEPAKTEPKPEPSTATPQPSATTASSAKIRIPIFKPKK